MNEIIVKVLHGPFDSLNINNAINVNKYLKIRVYKTFAEGIIQYKAWDDWIDKYIHKKVYFIVLGTKNPKIIAELVERTFDRLLSNDSYVIAVYNNVGELKKYCKFYFDLFELDHRNVRNPRDWPKLIKKCNLEYWDPIVSKIEDYEVFNFKEWLSMVPWCKDANKYMLAVIDFIEKYGDDFAHYALKELLKSDETTMEMVVYEAKQHNIKYDSIIQLFKQVCQLNL